MKGRPGRAGWVTVMATLIASTPAPAQLTISAAPVPTQVRPGTALIFAGQVLQSQASYMYIRVGRCGQVTHTTTYNNGTPFPECQPSYWHSEALTVNYVPHPKKVAVSFSETFIVPATAEPGDSLCFSFQESTSGGIGTFKAGFPVCRVVTAVPLTPHRNPVATAQPASPRGNGSSGRGERVAKPVPNGATSSGRVNRGTVRAARAPAVPPGVPRLPKRPDLSISYEKAPWAKWVVRNNGDAASTPTTLRLSRAAVPDKVIQVPALAAGAVHEIVVTPALDVYLVNAWAVVDPQNFVLESNEKNNTWKSVESR